MKMNVFATAFVTLYGVMGILSADVFSFAQIANAEEETTIPTEETVFAEPYCEILPVALPQTYYEIGETLDLSGLLVDLKYAPGGEIPISQLNEYQIVRDDVNPLDDPETFVVDTSAYNATTTGSYEISVSLTKDAQGAYWYSVPYTFTVKVAGVEGDEPIPPYMITDDSVDFLSTEPSALFDLIVSSNREFSAFDEGNTCTFTPEEDGVFVVSTRQYCEEIVECANGHFHYFFPILTNYTVTVEAGKISVKYQGEKCWYSEEQVNTERQSIEVCDVVDVCYNVYAVQPDDVLNEDMYYTFINGQLRGDANGYDSYIMNVYDDFGTDSYFCVNYESMDVQLDMFGNEPQRVTAVEMDISSLITDFFTSSTCDGNLEMPSPDIMELSRIAAPKESDSPVALDGGTNYPLTVLVDGDTVYSLTVENELFHFRKSEIRGDVNADGALTVADVVALQKWLLAVPDVTLADWKAGDLCEDDRLDVFDLCLMKRELLNQ